MAKKFPTEVNGLIGNYVNQLLGEYQ